MASNNVTLEKHLFYNITEVTDFLEDKGFIISNNKILWDNAESDTACYWTFNNNIINFRRSDGQNAFSKSLVDFNYEEIIEGETVTRPVCAIISVPLMDGGIAIYMGMVTEDTRITDITLSCANTDPILNNGLIVVSPAEDDGHWYYGWNGNTPNDTQLYWCLDNGHGNYEYDSNVKEVPIKNLIPSHLNITLVRSYLNTGYWSKNFRIQVSGDTITPGYIFKVNGQKYIVFTNNTSTRAPAYKLPEENAIVNLTTSTELYSTLKTYAVGDYCIYDDLLYKCIVNITEPEPFDENHWTQTTVHNELIDQGNNIYGD